jgi:hypothetical protein
LKTTTSRSCSRRLKSGLLKNRSSDLWKIGEEDQVEFKPMQYSIDKQLGFEHLLLRVRWKCNCLEKIGSRRGEELQIIDGSDPNMSGISNSALAGYHNPADVYRQYDSAEPRIPRSAAGGGHPLIDTPNSRQPPLAPNAF